MSTTNQSHPPYRSWKRPSISAVVCLKLVRPVLIALLMLLATSMRLVQAIEQKTGPGFYPPSAEVDLQANHTEIGASLSNQAGPAALGGPAAKVVAVADLSLIKLVHPAFAGPGETIIYSLIFSNAGDSLAGGVVLSDTGPAQLSNLTVVSSGLTITTSQSGPNFVWQVQDLAPGQSGLITITGQLTTTLSGLSRLINNATIATSSPENELANNSATAAVRFSPLVITEMMVNPASLEPDWEWLELYNAGSRPLDLAGFVLDDDDGVILSQANIIAGVVSGGSSAILYNADLPALSFAQAWATNTPLIAVSNWPQLANSGDQIGLWASLADYNERDFNAVIEYIGYSRSSPWPGDNNAASIVLNSPLGDNNIGSHWALSTVGETTPLFAGYQSLNIAGNSGNDIGSPGVPGPDMNLIKTAAVTTVYPGQALTYSLSYSNGSVISATGVIISDIVPAHSTFNPATSSPGWDCLPHNGAGSQCTFALSGSLSFKQSGMLSYVIKLDNSMPAGVAAITNTAQIATDGLNGPEPTPANNVATATVVVRGADLALSKGVNNQAPTEGQTITYTITLTNNGPGDGSGIVISDTMPAGLNLPGGIPSQGTFNLGQPTIVWTVDNLTAGQSATLTLTARVSPGTAGQTLRNTAVISQTDSVDPDPSNNEQGVAITVQGADLALSKVVDDPTPQESDTIAYTLQVTNNSPTLVSAILVGDSLPAGLSYAGSTATAGSYDPAGGLWSIGSLNPDSQARLVISATIDAGSLGQTITNTGAILSADQTDLITDNNTAWATIIVSQAGSELFLPLVLKQ